MSTTDKSTHIPSNEEIIEEITSDLRELNVRNDTIKAESSKDESYIINEDSALPADFEHSDSESETSKVPNVPDDFVDEEDLLKLEATFTEEEKEERTKKAAELKQKGNEKFKNGQYLDSITSYTDALHLCSLSNASDRAVLYCNRAASKIHLERKTAAIDDCSKAIELNPSYIRAYLRRAKLYEETDKLDESLEDYKKVLEFDQGNAEACKACVRLPPLINERNEKMKTEMMGKLKDLGNMILRPFGLSTENFQVNQDGNSGGYSINFQQNVQK